MVSMDPEDNLNLLIKLDIHVKSLKNSLQEKSGSLT